MDKHETQYYLLYRFLLSGDPADHAPWWDWVHEHEDTLPPEVFEHLTGCPVCVLRLDQVTRERWKIDRLQDCSVFRKFLGVSNTGDIPDIIRDKLCLLPSSRLTLQDRAKLLLCSYGLGDDFEAIGPFLDLAREHPEAVPEKFSEHLNSNAYCYLTSRGRNSTGDIQSCSNTLHALRGCHMAQMFLFDVRCSYDSMWSDPAYVGKIGDLRQQLWQKGGAVQQHTFNQT